MKDKNGEPKVWRTQERNDKKSNDQNVNKKQGKKHTRENIAPMYKHDVESNSNTETQQKIDEPLGLVEYF